MSSSTPCWPRSGSSSQEATETRGPMRPSDLVRRSAAYLEAHGVESRETAEAL